jgi:hypothetical protein
MYHDSGLCGFLKGTRAIIKKEMSLSDNLKFAMFIDSKQPEEYKTGRIKLIMARLSKVSFFPDTSNYKGYRND